MNDDSLVWAATPRGFFSVRSAYHCIRTWNSHSVASTSESTLNEVWKILWNLKVIPRCGHFLWKVLKGIVPTRKRLWNKGVQVPIFCPRCDQVAESIEHALRDCPWVRRVWFLSPLGFSWPSNEDQTFQAWCHTILLSAPKEVGEILATFCYYIWKARNALCFEGKSSAEFEVVHQALEALNSYQITQKQVVVPVRNSPLCAC